MGGRGVTWVRGIAVGLMACALAALVVQNATVLAFADSDPETAAAAWPSHPAVRLASATQQIASASGAGQEAPPPAFDLVERAARAAPLEPQPFIVAGVRAQLKGDAATADRAFEAARLRDPRSLPARYFLASTRLQRGNVEGLRDVAALARLAPNGGPALVPYIAAFAAQPKARGPIRTMFRDNPDIREGVLSSLAGDANNLRLVLQLGGETNLANAPWAAKMISTLVASRRYSDARALWERAGGTRTEGLFDGDFRNASVPPPFNWELSSSSLGLAERRSGRLQVIFYGQDSGTLARQLLLLPPGRYQLRAPASGSDGSGALQWAVRCEGREGELARAAAGKAGLAFAVPADCPAQWLELVGRASDFGQQADLLIGPLALARAGGR